jgi:hypothetical protein
VTRRLGKTDFEVTTLGLGGQGSLQWTGEGILPPDIIVKAHSSPRSTLKSTRSTARVSPYRFVRPEGESARSGIDRLAGAVVG